jgi:alanine racemase
VSLALDLESDIYCYTFLENTMSRPLIAEIFPTALEHNLQQLRQQVGSNALYAVIKANAYGHGIREVWPGLQSADGLAMIELDKAIACRVELGWRKPILLLEGFYSADELPLYAQHGLAATVHCEEQVSQLLNAKLSQAITVFLKVNTGMNRLGFTIEQAKAAHRQLTSLGHVAEVHWMTHFAKADEPKGAEAALAHFKRLPLHANETVSVANSAAIYNTALGQAQIYRAGIAQYGATPLIDRNAHALHLKPVMRLRSAIISTQTIEAGEAVGYGGAFVAQKPMRLGIVACGYADGYPRHAPNGTPVWVAGQRVGLVGRVSMDKLCVDFTEHPTVGVGAAVELWGSEVSVDEVAAAAGTISYELLTALNERVPKLCQPM